MEPIYNHSKSIFKEWLDKLQQESWQLELLISGFAIFAIYEVRTIFTDIHFFVSNQLTGTYSFVGVIILYLLKTGWLIFFINLIIHVLLRGLWIGAIGLRYVSEDINIDGLGYSEIFARHLNKKVGRYDNFIERLERICSVLFAFTFLLFLLFLSLVMFFLQIVVFMELSTSLNKDFFFLRGFFSLCAFVIFILGIVVFVDLITLGGFKKIKDRSVSKIYFAIYYYFSITTLSFLYRPLLYNFIDKQYTRKFFYLSIPYIFVVMGGFTMFENTVNPYQPPRLQTISAGLLLNDNYYDDLRNVRLQEYPNETRKINKEKIRWLTLSNFNITSSNASVFLRVDPHMVQIMRLDTTLSPYKKSGVALKWFKYNILNDKELDVLKTAKEKEVKELILSRKELNKSGKDKKSIDSINLRIDERISYWSQQMVEMEHSKIQKILSSMVGQFEMTLDTMRVPLSNCFFYKHPHYGENGLQCFFKTDSLQSGIHYVKVVKKIVDDSGLKIEKDSLVLPILKH
jgi:hypothetical protein